MDSQEAFIQGVSLAASCIYLVVAGVLLRRKVAPENRGPHRAFVVWWAGLGLLGILGVALAVGPGIGAFGLTVARVTLYLFLLLLFVVVAGLVHYLLYLYTGHKALRWIVAFYLVLTALTVLFIEGQQPYIQVANGHAEIAYHDEAPPGDPFGLAIALALILPPLGAAIAYLALYWQVHDRTSRYRILLVSGGIILWFAYSAVNAVAVAALQLETAPFALQVASRLLGVVAAAMVLLAYLPPRWLQRRLGVTSVLADRDEAEASVRTAPLPPGLPLRFAEPAPA